MSDPDSSQKVSSVIRYLIGSVSAVIGLALIALATLIFMSLAAADDKQLKMTSTLLSVVLPFALFLLVIAYRSLRPASAQSSELLSVRGWKVLAGMQLFIGSVCATLGHWVAILCPAAIAFFCIMKDPKVAEKMRALSGMP